MAGNKVHPLQKLQAQIAQIENTMSSVIRAAGKPDFVEGIKTLQTGELQAAQKDKSDGVSKGVAELCKLLRMYPGLTKDTLRYVKAEVTKFKNFGLLEEIKKSASKTKIEKSKEALDAKTTETEV